MISPEQNVELLLNTALQLPRQVLPIYEFAVQTDPAAIMVCDRDARPIGAALEAIEHYRQESPAVANRLFYRRISKRVPFLDLIEHIRDPLESFRDREDTSRIMVVDDYVSKKANTCHAFREACQVIGLKLPIDWVTLAGRGTALNVAPYMGPATAAPWRDREDVLGIHYEGTRHFETPTELSEMFYTAVRQGIKGLFEHTTSEENVK